MNAQGPALLLVAYGSCNARGLAAYRRFEEGVRDRYPGLPVRWAYTSPHIRTRLAVQVRLKSDSVTKAVHRLVLEHFGPIALQPLQIVPASENEEVEGLAASVASETGVSLSVGAPLLSSDRDMSDCLEAVLRHLPAEREPGEDVILMGHGARHAMQERYDVLSAMIRERDPGVHLATMSGGYTLEDILPTLTSERIWLAPFLAAVGKHTTIDMASSRPDSWKSRIEAHGHTCVPVISGVIEHQGFADIWFRHLEEAMGRLGIVARPRG